VASFRATLEEATHADVLLILLDVSDPSAELQYETVQQTLDDIFEVARTADERDGHEWREPERILLLNKADKLPDNRELLIWQSRVPGAIAFSAINKDGLGHEDLRRRIAARARGEVRELFLTLPLTESKAINIIENKAEVLDREYIDSSVRLRARIGERQLERLRVGGVRVLVEPVA
jgi:GTP-binding protein HflX